MPADTSAVDPTPVLDLLEAFRRSQALFAAVELGVFDRLVTGPAPLADLARDLKCNADALERLLGACVGLGLLHRKGAGYANTPAAAVYLTTASPELTGYAGYSGRVLWKLWGNLPDAVREGTHRWKQTMGWEGPIWDNLFRTDADRREFSMGMHGMGLLSSPAVAAAFDLGRFRRLADLGGATGHLAMAACRLYPQLQGVVVDLPGVLPLAKELVDAAGMTGQVELLAGDFFKDPLPPADLYALCRIMHDWSEAKIRILLTKLHAALPAGGGLLVAQKILDDDRCGPSWAVYQALNMLVCTEGKERTLAEYTALFKEAGFVRVESKRTEHHVDVMLALKA